MKIKTLLIEIGVEEIPSRLLSTISSQFSENFSKELKFHHILYKNIESFATPRRLALKVIDINTNQNKIEINKIGPAIINSYDKNGIPTKSAIYWAKKCGIDLKEADTLKTEKGEWLLYKKSTKTKKIEILIPKILDLSIKKIVVPKPMRWEIKNAKFSRPIRNLVVLLDRKIIKLKIFNISSNNYLYHHLCYQEKKITIHHAKEYPKILFKKNNIIANYNIRKNIILKKINIKLKKINGFIKNQDFLINEITAMVESPTAILATFKKKFLQMPKQVLIHTVEKIQKCFTIYNSKEELLPYFIFISNINSKETKKIIQGNERIMHARLSDVEFFLKNDKKIKLEDNLLFLKKILFQKNLGSLYEKTLRIKKIIQWISQYNCSNIKDSIRAAMLSKCDLATNMVCEFPELQGIIGSYYAIKEKEKKSIALALKEQYLPSFSGDKIPNTIIGCSLSIADKIDTISGIFCIGKYPTAKQDPFALRRLTIGILRIIIKKNIPLNLKYLINKSLSLHYQKISNYSLLYKKIIHFFIKRLSNWYEEIGYSKNIIQAVLSLKLTIPIEINNKIKAISFFQKLNCSSSIILLIKRISNILQKENKKISGKINLKLIKIQEEKILFNKIISFKKNTNILFLEKNYQEILLKIQELQKPIHNFFEKVKIYDDNIEIRFNRLLLLSKIEKIFFKIVNFSYLY